MKVPKFRIGIAMAGAVSAGAYTAGVIDYLLEALKSWEEAKEKNRTVLKSYGVHFDDFASMKELLGDSGYQRAIADPAYDESVPMHEVVIDVLGGASAGGMTAAVTTLALFSGIDPVKKRVGKGEPANNMIYEAWVNMNDKNSSSTLKQMFSTVDLKNPKKWIPSLLNSEPIANIARIAARVEEEPNGAKPGFSLDPPPYISKNLQVILTLCSLRGIPVDIDFETSGNGNGKDSPDFHRMHIHKWTAHFGVSGEEGMLNKKYPHILNFDPTSPINRNALINCAIGTGAFPFGLKSVQVKPFEESDAHAIPSPPGRYIEEHIKRMFDYDKKVTMVRVKPGDDFTSTVVDGGTINNEPFGEVQKVLESVNGNNGTEGAGDMDYYALLLIDPFPSYEKPDGFKALVQH